MDHVRQSRKLLALQQETEVKLELVGRGKSYWYTAYGVIAHAKIAYEFPDRQDEARRNRLIEIVATVWKNRDAIPAARWGHAVDSHSFCHQAMKLLEFDSPEDYLDAAAEMFSAWNRSNLPVIHDQASSEHKAFRSFIAESLDPIHGKYW